MEEYQEVIEGELEYITEISITTDPAVPEAKFIVVKGEGGHIEEEFLEEEEVSKNMDVEKLLKSILRKLKTLSKKNNKEEILKGINRLIEVIQETLEAGGEYGYPAPVEVAKSIDAINLEEEAKNEETKAPQDFLSKEEFEAYKKELSKQLSEINEVLTMTVDLLSKYAK